ncbi:MAG: HEAT repeat domain-containing protein [Planctomycetes bacterium]|nr:HEAT repeat domain-containing protein [Planctomycetota bacterium]
MGRVLVAVSWIVLGQAALEAARGEGEPGTGPETERRFPPLKVPPGFKASLFACDPLIEYPSVLALGPRPGSIFLAHDYMTGLGTEIVRRDEVRLVEDANGDGYADRSTVYATELNSVQGLACHEGRVYAMHAPLLTVLRDADGDGVADERRDLLSGIGWPPERAPDRLHCANGVTLGHDGWLYLALGDRGCDVARPEGDRLVLQGGGILRCKLDGTDLHVFATGLRNIYDVALDEELNVFVRDNENDGGTYMVRVCRSFFGADHGYPYLYEEHPDEALPPLADLGRGSSAGGACYLERAFPADYRGDLFFCEWGRSVVRYRRGPAGAGSSVSKEIEFAAGGPDDPYGFKPTDVIVDRDGSLLVADWADDQRPRRGRGRVYRIRHEGEGDAGGKGGEGGEAGEGREGPAGLDSESYFARIEAQAAIERGGADEAKAALGRSGVLGRLHAVWAMARTGGEPLATLLEVAETDPDPRVRVQAVRAVADLTDPVLATHRLEAGRGDPGVARRLAALGRRADPRVELEVTIALGRLRWAEAPAWLRERLGARESPGAPDAALAHAVQQTLRRSEIWPAVIEWLDLPHGSPHRQIALRALADRSEVEVVDGLIRRLDASPDPRRRLEHAGLLTRVWRKPGPWVYWGFRPGPRPPNTVSWERTEAIEAALDRALADPDRGVRLAVLRRVQRGKIPVRPETLVRWLREERDAESVAAILSSLEQATAEEARDAVEEVVRDRAHGVRNRLAALQLLIRGLEATAEGRLLELAGSLEEPVLLAEVLRELGRRPKLPSRALLVRKLRAPAAEVRIAAIEALSELGANEAAGAIAGCLEDLEAPVRAASASALGRLGAREAADLLLGLARDPDGLVRRRCLEALAAWREPRALPLALATLEGDPEAELEALECVVKLGGPEQAEAVAAFAARSRSVDVLEASARALVEWRRVDALARVQGSSGALLRWTYRRFSGPLTAEAASRAAEAIGAPVQGAPEGWRTALAAGTDARVTLGAAEGDSAWLALAEFVVPEPSRAQFLASTNGTLQAWLNGRPAHRRAQPGAYAPDSDRFEADLEAGLNRLVVQVSAAGPAQLHARFRRKSSVERHERLVQAALTTRGDPDRGWALFQDAEKSGCVKCHRIGERGGRIGPDLTGAGRRFSRIHLVESILEPSRVVAPSYRSTAVRLKDGQVLVGVKVAETEGDVTLGDGQGQVHVIERSRIEELEAQELSSMPEGLENGLTDGELVDLIAFLAAER